ncbi:amidohydrolase [Pseudomonas asplenii]|uniref:amidohydrolase family protein n=1 Tax=Pseudomonas asplenii TaxID=53407 RepID=UPI0037C908DC
MRITDAQIHLWTNDQAPARHWLQPFHIEDAVYAMNEAGIEGAINHPPNWDLGSVDYAVQAAQAHPDRFATLGWFPLDENANERDVDCLMSLPGMLGMRFILPTPEVMPLLMSGKLEWLWAAAHDRELPMGLFIMREQIGLVGQIAVRYPKMRLLSDHLGVLPFVKLPEAAASVEALLGLSHLPNVAMKATGVPSMSLDGYPFISTHGLLRKVYHAFGAERMFWGTDITRLSVSWRDCVNLFVRELDWLKGTELDAIMGGRPA